MDAVVNSCCFCSAIEFSADALMLRCLDAAGGVAAVLGTGCACIGLGIVVAGVAVAVSVVVAVVVDAVIVVVAVVVRVVFIFAAAVVVVAVVVVLPLLVFYPMVSAQQRCVSIVLLLRPRRTGQALLLMLWLYA